MTDLSKYELPLLLHAGTSDARFSSNKVAANLSTFLKTIE